MAKLSEIFILQMGKTPARAKEEYWNNGDNNWVSISDLSTYDKYVGDTKETISNLAVKDSGIKSVPADTVIMSFKLTLGKTAITVKPTYTNEAIMAFIPIGKYPVYPGYFYHFFCGRDWSKGTNRAVMGVTLNKATLGEIEVAIPSIDEQEKIARHLDMVDRVLSYRKEQLSKLDELVKSRFIEMFGGVHDSKIYPYKKVKDFTDVISGGTPSRDISEYWNSGTIPWVKTTELQNNVIDRVDEYISEAGLNNSSAKIVPPHTILIAMYGQGKTRGMTGFLGIEACTNQACACILPSNVINQKYLWQYFILSYDNLRDMAKGGNQPNLNGNIIKNYPVLFPPIELQNEFATFVEQTDKLKLELKESLEKLETLKKSLMQKYFG